MSHIFEKAIAEAQWYVSQYPSNRKTPKAAEADNDMTIANLTMGQVMAKAGIDEETISAVCRLWIKASITGENAAVENTLAKYFATQH